jgi:hypothetical protein
VVSSRQTPAPRPKISTATTKLSSVEVSAGVGSQTLGFGLDGRVFANSVKNSKVWFFQLAGAKVTDHVVHINEELEAAKAAKAAIDFLLTTSPKAMVVATLNKAKYAAVLNLSSGGALNEARAKVAIALSNLIHDHGPPTALLSVVSPLRCW